MNGNKAVRGLFAAATVVVLFGCGGGSSSTGAPPASPTPPAPAPSREGYARLVGTGGFVAKVSPTALTQLVHLEPVGSVTDSAVIYDAEVDAATGVASGIAPRYVLYTKAGRLYRHDLRDGGPTVQVSSRSDLCYFQSVNNIFDVSSTALVLNTLGTNATCFISSPASGRAVVAAAASATDPGRNATHQFEIAVTSANGARVGWLVFSPTGVPTANAVGFSASADLSAAPIALGNVPRMPRQVIDVPGGAYINVDDIEQDFRYFSVATNTLVAAPNVRGRVIGRDRDYAYLFSYPGSGGDYDVFRLDLRASGPAVPTLVGRIATAFSRGIGISSDAIWFVRSSAPFEVSRMPLSSGVPAVVGTMTVAPNQRERVVEFGDRVAIVSDEDREFFLFTPGAAATVRCCFVQYQAISRSARGYAADRLIYSRTIAGGAELVALNPLTGETVVLGVVPPAPAGAGGVGFAFNGRGYSHGSVMTARRGGFDLVTGAAVWQVLTARVGEGASLTIATP